MFGTQSLSGPAELWYPGAQSTIRGGVELGQEVRSAATASDEPSARATRGPTFLIVVNLARCEFLDGMAAKIG